MSSKKLPLSISFQLNHHQQINTLIGNSISLQTDHCFQVLVKKDDDLRKDQLIVGMIRIIGLLLEENGFTNHLQYYSCISTGPDEGLIEIVPHSITIGDIYNDQNNIENSLINTTAEKHSIKNKVNTAKRVLLHNFAIQEYIITHSTLSNHSLTLQRERRNEYARLQASRVLKTNNNQISISNSIDEISKQFAGSLGQYSLLYHSYIDI